MGEEVSQGRLHLLLRPDLLVDERGLVEDNVAPFLDNWEVRWLEKCFNRIPTFSSFWQLLKDTKTLSLVCGLSSGYLFHWRGLIP